MAIPHAPEVVLDQGLMSTIIPATDENEHERLQALRDLEILDTEREPEFDELVNLASAVCEVPISVVSLIDEHRQWFKAQTGIEDRETPRAVAFCNHAIRQPQMLVVEDATHDERFSQNPLVTGGPQIRFYAGMPVQSPSGHALGTLCVIDSKPRTLTDGQKAALRILAAQVNARLELRIERKKLEKALREAEEARIRLTASEERFRLFMDNSPLVSHIKDSEGRFVFYNQLFAERFGITRSEWLGKSSFDLFSEEEALLIKKTDDAVLAGTVFRAVRQSIHEHDGHESVWKSYKFPLNSMDGQNLIGVVGVEITEDLRREEALRKSQQELELANEKLQALAATDELTGLANRRAFDKRLAVEFAQAKRKARVLSVLVLDADNFKRRNDLYGHPEGDETLRQLSRVLEKTVRAADLAARYGGEEFVVLMPETTEAQGLLLAERILAAVRTENWAHEPVTVSIGVASLHPSTRNEDRLVALADEALYAAKRAGKDRAIAYGQYYEQLIESMKPEGVRVKIPVN